MTRRSPDPDADRVTAHLERGEFLLWVCRPHFQFRLSLIPVGFIGTWCIFIITEYLVGLIAIIAHYNGLHDLLSLIITTVLLCVSTWWWLRRRRATLYALTSARVLVFGHRSLTALPLRALSEWTCEERSNGYGDLVFGRIHHMHLGGQGDGMPTGLYNISNVKAVHALLDSAQRAVFNLPPRDPSLAASMVVD